MKARKLETELLEGKAQITDGLGIVTLSATPRSSFLLESNGEQESVSLKQGLLPLKPQEVRLARKVT